MSTGYPAAQDPTVVPGSKLSSNPHSTIHIDDRDAIRAIQSKLGTGSTAQSAADRYILVGTGAGASKWETAASGLSFTSPTFIGGDMNGTELILDADADTSITADTDDQIDIRINGADDFRFLANTLRSLSGSAIETDTINETTSANGVTIDGLSIKDSKLNTDASVIPSNLLAGTGSTWAWASWTPTYTNATNITTQYAKYIQMGKTVHFRIQFNLTGSSAISGLIGFSLPVAANAELSDGNDFPLCAGQLSDATASRWNSAVAFGTVSRLDIYYWDGSSNIQNTSSSAPFTWANNDLVAISGTYEAA